MKPSTLTHIRQFQIYYGPVTPSVQNALRGQDLLILEPRHVDAKTVRTLQEAGSLVIGYLSVMETPAWNVERCQQLRPHDSLLIDGRTVEFPAWNSQLMDLRQLSYQSLLLQEVLDLILVKGMDGVFLDTVGDLEEYVPAGRLREALMHAYVDFLKRLRTLAPEVCLIQNRGFGTLPLAATALQGVLWEDWRGDLVQDAWVQARVQLLASLQRQGLTVLTVSSHPERIHAKSARRLGFTHLTRSTDYLQL